MASTLSSVVLTPPEGDVTEYLESVRRLRTLPARLLLPAHGSVSAGRGLVLDECINHRRKREEQLVQALTAAPRRVTELAQEMYRGTPAEVMPYAEKQVLAGLLKLQREGQAVQEGDGDDPGVASIKSRPGKAPVGECGAGEESRRGLLFSPLIFLEGRTSFDFSATARLVSATTSVGDRGCPVARQNSAPAAHLPTAPQRAPGGSLLHPTNDSNTCPDPSPDC